MGDEIKYGDYNGGFTKVSMALAITQTCQHPAEAAMLINFLLNEDAGRLHHGFRVRHPALPLPAWLPLRPPAPSTS